MNNKPKPFTQYAYGSLINSEGKVINPPVPAKDARAYAQALGHMIDNPGVSAYATARYLCDTSHPEVDDPVTLEKAIGRWRKSEHWLLQYSHEMKKRGIINRR